MVRYRREHQQTHRRRGCYTSKDIIVLLYKSSLTHLYLIELYKSTTLRWPILLVLLLLRGLLRNLRDRRDLHNLRDRRDLRDLRDLPYLRDWCYTSRK